VSFDDPVAPAAQPPTTVARETAPAPGGPPPWFAALPADRRPALPLPRGVVFGPAPKEYVNEADGSTLAFIPAGAFTMGRRGDFPGDMDGESPAHEVTFTRGFFLGKHEVTWAQYRRFCAATRRAPPEPGFAVTDRDPVHNVTWEGARAYCVWAWGRLPSESEWEYAARGAAGLPFPWGRDAEPRRANLLGAEDGFENTAPVGSFPEGASPFGCLDMAGNIWEWVEDAYAVYPDRPEKDPEPAERGQGRVARGGGFNFPIEHADARNRTTPNPVVVNVGIGLRLARSVR
jgi:eukaryotic-like serine/threonine-protein kinase